MVWPEEVLPSDEIQYKDELIIIQLINAVNKRSVDAISPGYVLAVEESMVKSYHHDLKGKIKIIRKPRPTGN